MIVKLGPNLINLAAVRYAYSKPDDHGRSQVEVVWMDNSVETMPGGRIEDVEAQRGAIVPAPDGYHLSMKGGSPKPVVAFRIVSGKSIPITPDGEPTGEWQLLGPDAKPAPQLAAE